MWHDEFETMNIPGKDRFGFRANARYIFGIDDALLMGMAGGAAAGGLSGLFGKKKKPKLLMLPEQYQAYQTLLPAATQKGYDFMQVGSQPYPGQLTAPMSEYEKMGLGTLGDYLQSPLPTEGNLFSLSSAELEKTLGGKEYDPTTGPYYEAYRTKIMRELQQAKDRVAHRASASDAFFGGGRLQQERELEEGAMGSMAQTLGGLFEAERTRRLGAVPLALQTMGWAEAVPQQRVAASQQLGALPRTLEQAELTARYQDFVRQLTNMGMSLQAAMSLATNKPEYWMPQPADTSGMGNALGQLAMLAMLGGGGQTGATTPNPPLWGGMSQASGAGYWPY